MFEKSANATAVLIVAGLAIVGTLITATDAAAYMRTIGRAEIAHLDVITDSNFVELYQHPDLEGFKFTSIYVEPVSNDVRREDIYGIGLRPFHYDALTEDYHARLIAALEDTGLLTNEPDSRTLVISVALTDAERFQQQTTGSHLSDAASSSLLRGGAIMEMVWRAGPGGDIVLALRDGRTMDLNSLVTDRDDRFTDTRDVFDIWAQDLRAFFGSL